jgi:hypothetical protein
MEVAKDQKESVAAVLERCADRTIEDSSRRVRLHEGLMGHSHARNNAVPTFTPNVSRSGGSPRAVNPTLRCYLRQNRRSRLVLQIVSEAPHRSDSPVGVGA